MNVEKRCGRYADNFLRVVRESLRKSGYVDKDNDYIGILHIKTSAHDLMLRELGLP